MMHSEAIALVTAFAGGQEGLDASTLAGARIYLDLAGAVPRSELVRVLAQHLEVQPEVVVAAIGRLIADGALQTAGTTVALPAGTAARDTEEN